MYDQENIIMNVAKTGFTFAATPGSLDELSITPDNYKVRAKVNYRFIFFTRNNLFKNGQIGLTLPPEILVTEADLKITGI